MLNEAYGCLNAEKNHRGRAKQRVTLISSEEIKMMEVAPHLGFNTIAWSSIPKIARKKCIEHYGAKCAVSNCGFDFEKLYGDIGKGFIHVHHLTQLSDIGQGYEVDPIKDLRPVCPNCHAMLHQKIHHIQSTN